jgi:hypothetical protein
VLKGHRRRGAANALALKADLNHAIVRHVDQFNITAIGLDGRSNERQNMGDALFKVSFLGRSYGHLKSPCWPVRKMTAPDFTTRALYCQSNG